MRFTTPFNGYAVKFNPYDAGGGAANANGNGLAGGARIAVATAQNFGIIGNGRQHVLKVRLMG